MTMVILNNLSQIFRAANDAINHEMCLRNLLRAINYAREKDILDEILSPTEFDGLYQNLSAIVLVNICAPAA